MSVAIMFLILTRYQPGGGSEKATILADLTQPHVEGNANLANSYAALCKWEKLHRRCRELNLQVPDPLLIVRASDTLAKPLNQKPTTAFQLLQEFRSSSSLVLGEETCEAWTFCLRTKREEIGVLEWHG